MNLLSVPFEGSAGFLLRPYQKTAVDNTVDAVLSGDDPMVVMATGLGKTAVKVGVARQIAEHTGKRVLFLAHRSELLDQVEKWLARVDPERPASREQGDMRVRPSLFDTRYVVAMVQSIKDRLHQYDPDEYGLVVTDEGHHGVAASYRSVYDHFRQNQRTRFVGASATWIDARGKALGRKCGYNTVSFQMRIRQAIDENWLVPVRTAGVRVDDVVDWHAVPDDVERIDQILAEEGPMHRLVKATLDLAGDRQILAFCSSKKAVRAFAALVNRPKYRPGSARFLTDEQGRDPQLRRSVVEDFRRGLFQTLVNCGVFTEGTDLPSVSCIAIARACASESLAAQIVGRGMRTADGVLDDPALWADADARGRAIANSSKPDCLVLDYVLNVAGRKMLTVADVLGEEYSPQVRDYANDHVPPPAPGEPEDPLERLDRAEAEWALVSEEVERRACVAARSVTYRTETVDLFDPRVANPPPTTPQGQREPATENQVWYLVNVAGWKRTTAERLAKKQASAIIAKHKSKSPRQEVSGE